MCPLSTIAARVDSILSCVRQVPERAQGPVYLCLRCRGKKSLAMWDSNRRWDAGLSALLQAANIPPHHPLDVLEVCLTHSPRQLDPSDGTSPGNALRGIVALQVRHGGKVHRLAPTEMIARNLSFPRAFGRAAEELGVRSASTLLHDADISAFAAEQVLVFPGPVARIAPVFRGMPLVTPIDVTQRSVRASAEAMAGWLFGNVAGNGSLPYKYWPSRGHGPAANNMIRQWMATLCLLRWARRSGNARLAELADLNLEHNLRISYAREGPLGIIDCNGSVKLGAVALAALAIAEAPHCDRLADVERSLSATVDHLAQPDGSFRTFLRPSGRNDNQNFYSGEALLYWSHRLNVRGPDPLLLSRFMTSAEHYQRWHRASRNPAFVPWHTQACAAVWRINNDPRLRDWVFDMNDWLVRTMQQWDSAPFEDLRGRFYNPHCPDFGPPHASSDGVYLEGLADAFRLARETADRQRQECYRTAITRGLRNVLQLQFKDERDAYYVSDRSRVMGGVRTTAYDNTIRVDNVQHNLTALVKILDAFSPQDFLDPLCGV